VPTELAETIAEAQGPQTTKTSQPGRDRAAIAGKVLQFQRARLHHTSQRQFTKEQGIPRATMQQWLKQRAYSAAGPEEVAFFECPAGVAVLHRLVVAAHLVMSLMGACGIRLVCVFFEKAGLGPFVANSYGAQRKVAKAVEQETVAFGREERARLGERMPARKVTLVEDETFHPQPCLVASEPVSNFIVVEQYSEQRDAASWNTAVHNRLAELPAVQVVQVTSDQGKAIHRHVETELGGAHKSPDVFHVQYDVSGVTSAALATRTRQAQAELEQALQATQQVRDDQQAREQGPAGPGRPPNFAARQEAAEQTLQQAQQALEQAQAQQEQMRAVLRGISACYHPFELQTGAPQTAAAVRGQLDGLFAKARTIAAEASLPERSVARIEKAARVVPKMEATIAFFHTLVGTWVSALGLPQQATDWLLLVLLPMLYLKRAARVARDATARAALLAVVRQLEAAVGAAPAPWLALPAQVRHQGWAVAQQCADLFQRSSSCVEGRNGQLALRHHHLHRISIGRLEALTVIHNYVLQRSDGTTAAERFFGARPRDLFTTLCQRIPWPARPRKRASADAGGSSLKKAA
jgi:hypothetical protein